MSLFQQCNNNCIKISPLLQGKHNNVLALDIFLLCLKEINPYLQVGDPVGVETFINVLTGMKYESYDCRLILYNFTWQTLPDHGI